jgi:hydrogenase maturation factor HypF (carbamoyltransferase family)
MPIITKRRVEVIAFERERIVRQSQPTPCPVCRRPSDLLTARQAGAFVQVNVQSIYRWLSQGKAHGVKTCGGQHRICRHSLFLVQQTSL